MCQRQQTRRRCPLSMCAATPARATGLLLACGLGQKTLLLMLVRRAHAQSRPAVGAPRHLPARLRASPFTR